MRVRARRDLQFNDAAARQTVTLACGTELDVIPPFAEDIRAVATARDDLREIAAFVRCEAAMGTEPIRKHKLRAKPNDVLASWNGQIRFLAIGDEVEVVSR